MIENPRNYLRFAVVMGVTAMPLAAAGQGTVTLKVDPQQVDFLSGAELVTRYHKGPDAAKPFFWPVNGPRGVPLTRAWPMEKATPGGSTDHVHQKSVWFTHGDVILDGLEIKKKTKGVAGVDFWSEGPTRGVIVCTAVGQPELGTDRARLITHNEWRTGDGQKVLAEARTIAFHDYGDARLLVVDIDLHASAGPVTFGDTKEGSFGVRVNDQLRESRGAGKIENADGKVGEKACWGRLSGWCDYSGTIDGKSAGIAVLDDPKNPYPACWHVRAYGLMAANPFGRGKSGFPAMKGRTDLVKLAKGEHLKLRYGVLLHAGDAHEGKVAEYFERFVNLRK
jgi:Methane oxygenase PmoA